MKMQLTVMLIACTISFSTASAQLIGKDSMTVLKNGQESSKIQQSINDHKMDLAKLENKLAEKTEAMHKANARAQEAAEANKDAAGTLNDDANSKKRAKKARKSAKEAESASKDARNAQEDLKDLNEDIEDLRKKIAKEEKKLNEIFP